MRARAYQGAAELLVKGDGTPRSREQIIEQVRAALEGAHADGHAEGVTATREGAVREMLAIARGLEQDAHQRVISLERECLTYGRNKT